MSWTGRVSFIGVVIAATMVFSTPSVISDKIIEVAKGAPECTTPSEIAILGASSEASKRKSAWVKRFKRYAKEHWGANTEVHAWAGIRVGEFLEQGKVGNPEEVIASLKKQKPELVIMHLGANDYYSNRSPATVERDLRSLTRRATNGSSDVSLLYIIHWDVVKKAHKHPWSWSEYADRIEDVAVDYGAKVVDAREFIDPYPESTAGVWSKDQMHVNGAGHSALFAAVWNRLGECTNEND